MIGGGTSHVTAFILALTLTTGLYATARVSRRTDNPLFLLAYLFAGTGVIGAVFSTGISATIRTTMVHGIGVMGTGIVALAIAISGRSRINALHRRVERDGMVTLR